MINFIAIGLHNFPRSRLLPIREYSGEGFILKVVYGIVIATDQKISQAPK